MARYILDTFDWQAFNECLHGDQPEFITAVAKQIEGSRQQWPGSLKELPVGADELITYLTKRFSQDDWYADLGVEERMAWDQVVVFVFSKPARKFLKVKDVGSIESSLGEYVRGFLDIVKTGKKILYRKVEYVQYDPQSECQAFGSRPFRFKEWNPSAVWNINPFTSPELVYLPTYSIHSPSQVATLLSEVKRVDVSTVPQPEYLPEYESQFLVPLEDAAENQRALYVWADT